MASTREIRRRIKSVKSTAQITKAMQLVAAAKMHKAQEAALNGKYYNQVMQNVLASLSENIDPSMHELLQENNAGDEAIVFISSNRGLAGAFTSNLLREAEKLPREAEYITLGKKGKDYIVKTKRTLTADFELVDRPDYNLAKQLAKLVLDDYLAKKVKRVTILYTNFINTLTQKPVVTQLLPIAPEALKELVASVHSDKLAVTSREYIFEPGADILLDFVLRHFVEVSIYQALLESTASEHSARMIAMKNATDNANDLVSDLTLAYNQARQDAITRELLEITTAAIALE